MQVISLTVKTRRGVTLNQVQLVDVDDIAAPLIEAAAGLDSSFTLREGKKGPFHDSPTNTDITAYVVDETLAQIAAAAGNIFTANVLTYKTRTKTGSPLMGFNAKMVSGTIVPYLGGSKFMYQEDSDPALVEYTVSQTPAQILAQITSNTSFSGWELDGNTNGAEKYFGTNDNFDVPVYINGVEVFRFNSGGFQYPTGAGLGLVLTSDGLGNASWQNVGGGSGTNELDPVISQTNTPAVGPATGDRYLVGTAPTGAWSANANDIAEWDGAAWVFTTPALNDYVYVTTTLTTLKWNGTAWIVSPGVAILQNGNTLGPAGARIGTNDAGVVWIKQNNILRVRIDGSDIRTPGSIYLGIPAMTSAPTARLQVRGADDLVTGTSISAGGLTAFDKFIVRNNGIVQINASADTSAQLYVKTASLYGIATESTGGTGIGLFSFGSVIGVQGLGGAGSTHAAIFTQQHLSGDVVKINSTGAGAGGIGIHVISGTTTSSTYAIYADDGLNLLFFVRGDGVSKFSSTVEGEGSGTPMFTTESTGGGIRHHYVAGVGKGTFIEFYNTVTKRAQIYVSQGGLMGLYSAAFQLRDLAGLKRFSLDASGSILIGDPADIYTASARLHVVGEGSTSATYGFKVENSTNTGDMLVVRNDGFVGIGTPTFVVNTLSRFTFKSTYLWAEFMDGTDVTTGLIIRKDTNIATAVAIGTKNGMNADDLSKNASILFDNATGMIAFGGYPYPLQKFTFNLNYQANNAQERFAISGGLHGVNTGANIWFYGAPNSASNTNAEYGAIEVFKENAVDTDTKAYMKFSTNNGVSVAESMRIKSTGTINLSLTQTGNAGLATGDVYKDTAANILANGDYILGMKA